MAVLCSEERADNFMASSKTQAHRQSTGQTCTYWKRASPHLVTLIPKFGRSTPGAQKQWRSRVSGPSPRPTPPHPGHPHSSKPRLRLLSPILLTSSTHQPTVRARWRLSASCFLGSTSSRNVTTTVKPRLYLPPMALYSRTWGKGTGARYQEQLF